MVNPTLKPQWSPSAEADNPVPDASNGIDDYYLKVQASALLSKYRGPGRGLPITLSPEECDRLEMLSHSFGAGFSLNNVICIAFRFLAEDPSGRLSGKYESDRPGTRILKIRPTEDSMMAILKSNKKDAGTHLARVGVNELYLRLFKAA